MDELEPINPSPPEPRPADHLCSYCGARLNAFYYFCTGCGLPYKDVSAVVSAAAPPPLSEGELIRRKAPAVAAVFWTYLTVVLGSAILAHLLFQEDRPDLRIFLADAALFITTCVFGAIYWRSLAAQLRRIGFDRPVAWAGLALLVPFLGVNYAYHVVLLEPLGLPDAMPLRQLRDAGLSELTLIVLFCAFPAVTEEIAFRGLIQPWLAAAIAPWRALVLASFLFAVLHFSVLSFPYLFGVGLLLGWVRWKTGSLYPPMVIHFLHNLAVIEYF